MNQKVLHLLIELQAPLESDVDHLLLLHQLYNIYSESGDLRESLQPMMNYFLDGLDDLPTLKDREHWNEERFQEIRKPFTESYDQLLEAIEDTLMDLS